MSFNPAEAYLNTQMKFVHFLLDRTMGAVPREGEESYWRLAREQLKTDWLAESETGAALYAAPVLEGLFPYPAGAEGIGELERDGVLERGMRAFIRPDIVEGRYNLYKHQADSIRASGVEGKDIIVSSGTGSGKTECFLYSMINNMLRANIDFDAPGVRVLMIYPRNALVKDQLRRILDMVMGKNPRISVGMYIGETERNENAAMSDWEEEMSNQFHEDVFTRYYRRTRDEIRRNPPHILITNYSMLEWMMLRDVDQPIFEQSAGKLQAIVLDEAHLYSGALGNDINMLIRRALERFNVSKDTTRFYATSATIGDGRPETLRRVASTLFGIDESRVRPITGDRQWPTEARPIGGDFSEEERDALKNLRTRLVSDTDENGRSKPRNFLSLNMREVGLLSRCSPEVTDPSGTCFLPYKLHTFMDIPKMVYSDLNVADGETRPLGNLQLSPVFKNGIRGVEVYSVTPRSSDESGVYFKAYLEEEARPPFTRRLVAATSTKALKPLYFRRRIDGDGQGFNLVFEPQRGWRVSEAGNAGTFVLAKRDTHGGMWAGAASDERWLLRDGETVISTWDGNVGYGSSSLVPLAFMPQDIRLAAYTEMLFPELPSAEVPEGEDPETYLYERSWQGRQMLVFSDSRSKAASTAPTLQSTHQQEFVKNCIYRELAEIGGTMAISDISTAIFESYANEFHLSQNLYEVDAPTQNDLKRDCLIPSLVYCSLAIASETRSLEEVGAITRLNARMPVPGGAEQEVLFNRLMIPGEGDPTPARKERFWQDEVVPAIIDLFRRRRAVYFRPAHEQMRQEVGHWTREIRRRHEALGTGLGYVWYDLRNKMFLTEQNFVDAREGTEIYCFMAKYFRLVANDQNLDLRRSLFTYLRTCARQLPQNVTDANLANAGALVCITNWRPARDDDEAAVAPGRGRVGVALNPYVFQFESARPEGEFEHGSYFYRHVTDLSAGGWGGLSVPEHSAQLQTDTLEDIEAKFKDHRLNVISCTPTLEVGIDIGALPVITMANLPPDKAGYLQRAGRAGRGPKATAMITTFLSDSVWDKLVKQDSMSFFRRENVFSVANVESPSVAELVKKHVYLFLLGSFFAAMYSQERNAGGVGQGIENPILAWDRVGTFLANAEHLQYHCDCLQRRLDWLEGNGRRNGAKWRRTNTELQIVRNYIANFHDGECPRFRKMRAYFETEINDQSFVDSFSRVIAGTTWAADVSESLRTLVMKLIAELEMCSLSLNEKLDELRMARQRIENGEIGDENHNRLTRLKNLLDVQFSSLYGEYLISYLTHNRIVPAYGFPIDVLSLVSGEAELQRQKLLAIREFTPGNRIPMGHTYTSVDALSPNYGADDERRYRLWYLVGRCPRCQEEIPPQEIGVGEVHCPYCEHVFEPEATSRTRCIEPIGFRSLKDPVNAALTRKRMSYVSPDLYLELHSLARIGGADAGAEARVCASCHYCESGNPAEMAVLKAVNEGPGGNGFAVHRESGRAIADAPARVWRLNAGDLSEDERKQKERVKRWQSQEVGDNNEAHYINNASLLCWMQVPTFVVSMQDVMGGILLGEGADSRALRTLLKMAILRQASEELKLDSRALVCEVQVVASRNVCHFALYSTDGDADCYFSEIEHIVNDQVQTSGENGFLRRALLRIHQTAEESQDDLLAYSNAHEYMLIGDDQFASAHQWVENNLHALTHQQQETVNGLTLRNPVDPLMAITKGTGSVMLMFPDLTIADIEEGSVILDLLKKVSSSCEINVVYDELNGGERTLSCVTQGRMWALSQADRRLKFRPVSPDLREEFYSLHDNGAHFAIDGHWYFLRTQLANGERQTSFSRKSWLEFLTPTIRKSCWTAEGRGDVLARFMGLSLLNEPPMPVNQCDIRTIYTKNGLAYSNLNAAKILEKLGIDTSKIRVKCVHYEDRYFMTPKSWIYFSWLLREFRFEGDARIDIVTMPLDEKPGHPVLNLFGYPLDRFLVRPTNARILGYAITREDAEGFKEYVARKIGINSERFVCSYAENPADVSHGREMQIELVGEDGGIDRVSIFFDSGMDMLRFNLLTSYPLFSDALKSLAVYDQRYYIVRGAA